MTAINQTVFIIEDEENNEITFQSYQSEICTIKNGSIEIFEDWNYSQTTLRHFKAFIEQFTNLNYQQLKKELLNGLWVENGSRYSIKFEL